MKIIRTLLLSFILLLLVIGISHAEFIVKTVYFQPKNAPDIEAVRDDIRQKVLAAQELYANELERHGFGNKTFRLERDRDGVVVIHHVNGKQNGNHYVHSTWSKILLELPDRFNQNVSPWNKQDMIFIIVIGGIRNVNSNKWGIGWPRHSNRYGGACYMVGEGANFNKYVVFHELGHCFALYHKEESVDGQLEHYEARWLSKHYHFNSITNNFRYPKPVTTSPKLTNLNDSKVRFELKLTSTVPLHNQ